MLEEGPRVLIVFCFHKDANATFPVADPPTVLAHPFFPDHAEKKRASGVHYGDIR